MANEAAFTGSPLTDLGRRLLKQPGMGAVIERLQHSRAATVVSSWGSSASLVISALNQRAPSSIIVVLPREREVDEFAADVRSFGISCGSESKSSETSPSNALHLLSSWPSLPSELSITDPVLGNRLKLLRAFESTTPPRIVITTISALMQPVPTQSERAVASRILKVGGELNLDELTAWLASRGFERVTAIESPGEFTVHGGIVDLFPPDSAYPIRLELFGDEIESIRLFEVESQRKVRDLDEATITILSLQTPPPAFKDKRTLPGEPRNDEFRINSPRSAQQSHRSTAHRTSSLLHSGEHILDALPADAWVVLVEREEVLQEGKRYWDRLADRTGLFTVESTLERVSRNGCLNLSSVVGESGEIHCQLRIESIERFGGQKTAAFKELERVVQQDETVVIACHNEAARQRMAELLKEVYDNTTAMMTPLESMRPRQGTNLLSGSRDAGNSLEPSVIDPMLTGQSPLKKFLQKKRAIGSPSSPPEQLLSASPNVDPAVSEESDDSRQTLPKNFADRVTLCVGHISRGFRLITDKIVVLSDNELFHRTELQRAPKRSRIESRAIDTFLDLSPGDLVVHLSHGIARFRGMEVQSKGELTEEMLSLEFADSLKMYVPASLIHLVQKYVGGSRGTIELSKYGGSSWANRKRRVTEAVGDMAADMLKLQAERDLKPGLACPEDSHWVEEFDAAFPYTETIDQLQAIVDTKEDMQRSRPMDRLICGDVGYGKTEIAMRATFKAVDAGRQVAILVPTTVLCEQHLRSFTQRMAEFPVHVAALNRFRSTIETREVLRGLAEGTIDVLIGTHRLVSKDVKFKNLGLLVIDEEQRFGVEVKELLKHLRLEVDVLTLSATPIPRTLHMSLVGVRDISNLETPPHDRHAVETRLCRWDGEQIRAAIVRELNRNGQTYFVHNRVHNIQAIADMIRGLVPEAKVDIVHGQMNEDEMEATMLGFVEGRTDVLVATTIIESGLDIPNANTIFIHQADKYGLADLHQLRGRVGRYKHQAYCYLMLEEGRRITPLAAKRLKAIEEYSELGAGFKISMRDLEIRGAGNILGTEQSGHITAVGYELYCQLLENAVRTLKRQPLREQHHVEIALPFEAYLPSNYIPDGRPKLEMYRKLSAVSSLESLTELKEEFCDRFGPLPPPAVRMFELRELQLLAWRWQIDDIRVHEGDIVFGYRSPKLIARLVKYSYATLRIVDDRDACLILPTKLKGTRALMRLLKETLQANPE